MQNPGILHSWGTALGLVLGIVVCSAQSTSPSQVADTNSLPKIQFAELVHDFGQVKAGDPMRCEFVFTNIGAKLLELTEVRPSCGCTTSGVWDKQVEPGKTGKIPLQVGTASFRGQVVKTVTVVCNDPGQSNIVLQLKANIWTPVDVAPNTAVFSLNPDSGTNESRTVKVTNNLPDPLEVFGLEVGNPAFRAELKTNQVGKEFELHIWPNGPFNPGQVSGVISLKTSSTNIPVINVTAISMVQPSVMPVPAQISLPPAPLPNATPTKVTIQNNGSKAISVSNAVVNVENVQVQIEEAQAGRQFNLTLTFPAGFEVPAGRSASLTLSTSDVRVPSIVVPIIQVARPVPIPLRTTPPTPGA